jgi:hypothetical protein
MTVINALNCIAITFVPPWLIYKYKLQEFADPRMFFQAGFWYATIQLLQLVLIATFVPSTDPHSFDFAQECMKAFITLCDCLGLYRTFATKKLALGSAVLIGLSWGTTESILHRAAPLAVEARGLQFSWKHLLTALEGNISLGTYMGLAVLMWLWVRRPAHRNSIVLLVCAQRFFVPIVARFLRYSAFTEAPALAVGAQGLMMAAFCLTANRMSSATHAS